jgi:hypothetical protein
MLFTELFPAVKLSSTLQMEAVCSSEMLVNTYQKLGVIANKTIIITMLIRIFIAFMTTEGSVPYSQNSAFGNYSRQFN